MLTNTQLHQIFEKSPGFDLRHLLQGSEKFVDNILNMADTDPSLIFAGVSHVHVHYNAYLLIMVWCWIYSLYMHYFLLALQVHHMCIPLAIDPLYISPFETCTRHSYIICIFIVVHIHVLSSNSEVFLWHRWTCMYMYVCTRIYMYMYLCTTITVPTVIPTVFPMVA